MADRPEAQDARAKTGTWEEPRLAPQDFVNTPEFKRFKRGMKKILKVSKAEIDRRVNAVTLSNPKRQSK
jgi:hypothetical protein